jgi:hypothetical protein
VKRRTRSSDKPCYDIEFSDGAVVAFYIQKHPKAKRTKTHMYLCNPEVKVQIPVV